jgi:hypothetical protein
MDKQSTSGFRIPPTALGVIILLVVFALGIIIPYTLSRDVKPPANLSAIPASPTATEFAANSSTAAIATPSSSSNVNEVKPPVFDKCAVLENQLAVIENDEANVERMLDATEDYSEEGTIKKQIYFNSLKRKGELQLQHIALERKLGACRSKK